MLDWLARGQAVSERDNCPFGVTEDQQVGFRIGQYRTPHLVRPIIVVGDAAQTCLNRADHDVGLGIRLAAALGIDHDRSIWSFVGFTVRSIGVL